MTTQPAHVVTSVAHAPAVPGRGDLPSIVISLDFEMRWGVHHRLRYQMDAYRENLEAERTVVPALLKLFAERVIRATWATVGGLACKNWDEYFRRAPLSPRYANRQLAVSPLYAELDPAGKLYFAPDLVQSIHDTPGQELGTHTFSHIPMDEAGVTAADVKGDLEAVAVLWRERFGAAPVSLVFPRNQTAFTSVVHDCGIRIWRGNETPWYHRKTPATSQHVVARALRWLDAVDPLVRRACALDGCMTRASLFLRTDLTDAAWGLHLARIRRELTFTSPDEVFHLWWHPHNLGVDTQKRMARLEHVLDLIAEKSRRGLAVSRCMADLVPAPCERPEPGSEGVAPAG